MAWHLIWDQEQRRFESDFGDQNYASVAELAYAPVLEAGARKGLRVQVSPLAPGWGWHVVDATTHVSLGNGREGRAVGFANPSQARDRRKRRPAPSAGQIPCRLNPFVLCHGGEIMVYAPDLKSDEGQPSCRFDPGPWHQNHAATRFWIN